MNRPKDLNDDDDEVVDNEVNSGEKFAFPKSIEFPVTAEDIQKEEEAIRDLEIKKRTLEDRVSGMERDLGGLLR